MVRAYSSRDDVSLSKYPPDNRDPPQVTYQLPRYLPRNVQVPQSVHYYLGTFRVAWKV